MPGERFEVEVEKIVAGGLGLARLDGLVVLVPGTASGERHLVEVTERKKDFLRAKSVGRITASSARREPPCLHATRCGGCALMHLRPDAQLAAKREILIESLERSGVVSRAIPLGIRSSPELGYRSRVRFHVGGKGSPRAMGFRRRGSRIVEDIDRCVVTTDGLNDCWQRLRDFFATSPARVSTLETVVLQESNSSPGRIAARFVVRSKNGLRNFDQKFADALKQAVGLDGLTVSTASGSPRRELVSGQRFISHELARHRFRQNAGSFFQANRFLLEELVAAAVPGRRVERAVDLFAGVGLFALPLAATSNDVVAVESDGRAVADGIVNARSVPGRIRYVRADAARFASSFAFAPSDYVVVDPPRGGLSKSLATTLAASSVTEICYVSCDPPALGRDAKIFEAAGFAIEGLELFDLFPNTHHFETVARFRRNVLDPVPRPG